MNFGECHISEDGSIFQRFKPAKFLKPNRFKTINFPETVTYSIFRHVVIEIATDRYLAHITKWLRNH